ncbi:MAG TPA: sodium:calcium antiporter [Candidatus Limnocylindria bacterium]
MESVGTLGLLAILVAGGAATWVAGFFLSKATDRIDDHFGLGQALGGMLLLGIAGTLPEIAITVSAAVSGHLDLAVGNLLGGIAMQTLVLVLLDATSRNRRPLSNLSNSLEPLHEAALVIGVVGIAVMGTQLDAAATIGPASPASLAIVALWLIGIFTLNRNRRSPRWQAAELLASTASAPVAESEPGSGGDSKSIGGTLLVFGLASGVTLVAGVLLEQSGNALADDIGMNGAIFGATVLAAITALPEISTGLAAVRMGQVGLAMGDIFGGNAIQVTLFLVADLLAGQAVLTTASVESIWLACLGIVVTAVYLNGLVTRPERKVLGVGPDSLLVAVVYILGVIGLLFLKT